MPTSQAPGVGTAARALAAVAQQDEAEAAGAGWRLQGSIFIEYMDWMGEAPLGSAAAGQSTCAGDLSCIGCKRRVGQWRWSAVGAGTGAPPLPVPAGASPGPSPSKRVTIGTGALSCSPTGGFLSSLLSTGAAPTTAGVELPITFRVDTVCVQEVGVPLDSTPSGTPRLDEGRSSLSSLTDGDEYEMDLA